MGQPLDLIGERFGRLTVLGKAPNRTTQSGNSYRAWFCVCDCGNKTIIATTRDLRKGDVTSCGCLKAELDKSRNVTHGDSKTRLYSIWKAMRKRRSNPNNSDYEHYGERGIAVCDSWMDYSNFKKWALSNGYSDYLTIDRIDVDGDYSPENCRWILMKEQCNNRTSNVFIDYNGVKHTIQEWSELMGIPYSRLYMRLRKGWDIERALTTH